MVTPRDLIIFAYVVCCSSSNDCDYELINAEQRNILFVGRSRVGRSRVGKSRLISVLKNKDHSVGITSVVRGTVDAKLESFTMHLKIVIKIYILILWIHLDYLNRQ